MAVTAFTPSVTVVAPRYERSVAAVAVPIPEHPVPVQVAPMVTVITLRSALRVTVLA